MRVPSATRSRVSPLAVMAAPQPFPRAIPRSIRASQRPLVAAREEGAVIYAGRSPAIM